MRQPIFFLALLINAVTAFSPATSPASRSKLFQVRTPLTRLNSATTKMSQGLAIPFFDKLPWNAQREKDRESRRLRREMAELHRQLGIVEGASYEEIVAATDRLIGLAGSDIKKKIKVEMAKDKIFQIQLNERLAGLADVSLDARSQSTIEKGK
mmetsp:Transcript_7862/g.11368  ORF Transcript_7862/g.11368 Transcript_7862/m.11368 type:complete len:154 (+) Transcript_7862:129-590(+)